MIILGSNSKGRFGLLKKIVNEFVVIPSDYDEDELNHSKIKPSSLVKRLSKNKLLTLIKTHPNDIIICADTIVYQNKVIYGKPVSRDDAFSMLKLLSSKPHYVYSGVAIYKDKTMYNYYDKTKVIFYKLSDKQINEYLDTGEYVGKAGSYAIQSLNDGFIKAIVGDFDNIIGMSLERIKDILGESK